MKVERVVEWLEDRSKGRFGAPLDPARAEAIRQLIAERDELRADCERLRWRHRDTLPEWDDLPGPLRGELVAIGEQMFIGDTIIRVWNEIRKALNP